MIRIPRPATAIIAAALTLATLSACSSSGHAHDTPSSPPSTSTTGATTVTDPAASSTAGSRPLGEAFSDAWHMQGGIPYNFKTQDGASATAAITYVGVDSVHVMVSSAGKVVTSCDLKVGGTCTFAGRTWQATSVSTDGRGSADLVATTPAP